MRPLTERDAKIKAFMKVEKIDFTAKPDPAPRVIQPRDPRFNVELGRYIRPIEGTIYDAMDKVFGKPVIAKGRNAQQVGKMIADIWHSYDDPVAVLIDAKRFDQHCSEQALKFEHSFYNSLFRCPELRKLLRQTIKLKAIAITPDGRVVYEVIMRASGDVTTSLGNIIIMTSMSYAYIETKPFRMDLVNAGDDEMFILERSNLGFLNDLEGFFLQFGYNVIREEPVFEIEKISFCQTRPVLVGSSYRMVREVGVALSKDSMYISPLDEQDWNARRLAISQCGMALAGDVPIFGAFYECLARGAKTTRTKYNIEVSGLYMFAKGMTPKRRVVEDATRVSFYRAFGITPERQLAIEAEYDNINLHYSEPKHHVTAPYPLFNVGL